MMRKFFQDCWCMQFNYKFSNHDMIMGVFDGFEKKKLVVVYCFGMFLTFFPFFHVFREIV